MVLKQFKLNILILLLSDIKWKREITAVLLTASKIIVGMHSDVYQLAFVRAFINRFGSNTLPEGASKEHAAIRHL